jgi:signal peptidase I
MSLKQKQGDVLDRLQTLTETCLSRRKRARRLKKEKLKGKNVILDWIEALLWAAGMVLLINQYLVQAYQIPSGSMIDTLNIGDHIFVNKLIYGPELLPGLAKVPSPAAPKRNDIIIFENPSYISRGPVFDIAQRIIYMLTLSLVDIDKDEAGQPKAHFLIKRAVGLGGDRFTTVRGEMLVRFAGEDRWTAERDFALSRGFRHNIGRLLAQEEYPALEAAARAAAFESLGLPVPRRLRDAALALPYAERQTVEREGFRALRFRDLAQERAWLETLREASPEDRRYAQLLARHRLGWYVPEGRVLPLGDNRDNSRDGRYFGPVRLAKVLGKGALIYWPLGRAGRIR